MAPAEILEEEDGGGIISCDIRSAQEWAESVTAHAKVPTTPATAMAYNGMLKLSHLDQQIIDCISAGCTMKELRNLVDLQKVYIDLCNNLVKLEQTIQNQQPNSPIEYESTEDVTYDVGGRGAVLNILNKSK